MLLATSIFVPSNLNQMNYSASFEVINFIADYGDGVDEDLFNFINLRQAQALYSQNIASPSSTIAIIDSGLNRLVWNKLVSDYGVDITYVTINYKDPLIGSPYYYISDTIVNSADSNVKDNGGHGSFVTSLVAQVAPGSKIILVSMDVLNRSGALASDTLPVILEYLYNGGNVRADVITMSFQAIYGEDNINLKNAAQNLLSNLHSHGVQIFASAGNNNQNGVAHFPSDFNYVNSIGAIYDDRDGYMTNYGYMNENYSMLYCGYRVSPDKNTYMLYGVRNPAYGSNFNNQLDFVMPGFDVEGFYSKTGIYLTMGVGDGTSFSAPIAAAIALLVHDALKSIGKDPAQNIDLVEKVLKQSSEGVIYGHARFPTQNSYPNFPNPNWYVEYGYGVIDAYDALKYVFTVPPSISIISPSGSTVSGTVTITANAVDDFEIEKVMFYINNVLIGTDYTASYSCQWNTLGYPPNSQIKVVAYDNLGLTAYSILTVSVTSPGGIGFT